MSRRKSLDDGKATLPSATALNGCKRQSPTTVFASFIRVTASGRKGGLYLLPMDVDVNDLEKTGVSDQDLKEALLGTPGQQVLLILDACHAGAADIGQPSAVTASSTLTQELGREENGIIVMCSSIARQTSQENNASRQSNYTQALLEGLKGNGQTASKDGIVYQHKLSGYVKDRVLEMSQKTQMPTECIPPNVPLFPLARQ